MQTQDDRDNRRQTPPRAWFPVGWVLLLFAMTASVLLTGQLPVDMRPYFAARERIQKQQPIYPSVQESQRRWKQIHANAKRHTHAKGHGKVTAGPYVYPPTLGLWLHRLSLPPLFFLGILFGAFLAFLLFWRHRTLPEQWGWWVFALFSWDVIASLAGGNVELLLLTGAILACWCLFHERPVASAPMIALSVLCKPFYALLFVGFGLLWLAQHNHKRRACEVLLVASLATSSLILWDVALWGPSLRTQFVQYLSEATSHQWMSLPLSYQTPMSGWNRSLTQGLVLLGVHVSFASFLTLGLWSGLLGYSCWRVGRAPQSFAWLLSVALVLFYWAKPVTWGTPLLELVLLTALSPLLTSRQSRFLRGAAWTLIGSRWLALFVVFLGFPPLLLTLQTASFPWETWLLFPACLALLFWKQGPSEHPR